MAKDLSFTLEGLDELQKDFSDMLRQYPDETEKEMYRLGGAFTKDVNAKFPSEYAKGKRPLAKNWHRTREKGVFGGYTVGIEIENTAPHWHLVENGHEVKADPKMYAAYKAGKLDHAKPSSKKHRSRNKSSSIKVLGWAPGKGYCQKTRDEWNGGEFAAHVQDYLDAMKKRHNL